MAKNGAGTDGYNAPAVERAFRLLDVVAGADEAPTLSELARTLGFSKSTTHGLVHALIAAGALTQDPGSKRLWLGPAVVELALKNREVLLLGDQAQPLLEDLRDRIDESVFLGMMSRFRTLIMAAAEARKSMKISALPGTAIPLLAGAVGKVLLAQMSSDQARETIRRLTLPRFTSASIVDEQRFLTEVQKVRKRGVAVDCGEYLSGVNAAAIGLGKHRGIPLVVWAVGFAETLGPEKISSVVNELVKTGRALQDRLGPLSEKWDLRA
jgi:DNA-binding IclR family transcriptional regulator